MLAGANPLTQFVASPGATNLTRGAADQAIELTGLGPILEQRSATSVPVSAAWSSWPGCWLGRST